MRLGLLTGYCEKAEEPLGEEKLCVKVPSSMLLEKA
jgi:hypothetical protein